VGTSFGLASEGQPLALPFCDFLKGIHPVERGRQAANFGFAFLHWKFVALRLPNAHSVKLERVDYGADQTERVNICKAARSFEVEP
jgi:hypothetical protein